MNVDQNKNILLDSGTNEIEICELLCGGQSFGVNALKIKHILKESAVKLTKMPSSHPSVVGSFSFFNKSIILIDLNHYFKLAAKKKYGEKVIIVCEFNNNYHAFLIDSLSRIYRVSWNTIQVPSYIVQICQVMITGVATIENRNILLIDFESIISAVIGSPDVKVEMDKVSEVTNAVLLKQREKKKILFCDDSTVVRNVVEHLLIKAGYKNLTIFTNGQDTYDQFKKIKEMSLKENKDMRDYVNVLISDIEMPQMDGLTLCKKVKEINNNMMVIIASSLVSEQMAIKCQEVGSDAYISKKDLNQLVPMLDKLL